MPCRDYDDDRGQATISRLSQRNDILTQMLCKMCQAYDDAGEPIPFPSVAKWWKQHKEADAKAEAEKRAEQDAKVRRARALAKLTAVERKVLGLK